MQREGRKHKFKRGYADFMPAESGVFPPEAAQDPPALCLVLGIALEQPRNSPMDLSDTPLGWLDETRVPRAAGLRFGLWLERKGGCSLPSYHPFRFPLEGTPTDKTPPQVPFRSCQFGSQVTSMLTQFVRSITALQ
jgi:hypothetical protein